jgi:hypothetical protein
VPHDAQADSRGGDGGSDWHACSGARRWRRSRWWRVPRRRIPRRWIHGGRFRGGHEHFEGFGRFHHFGGFFFPYAYYPYPGYAYAYPYPVYSPPAVVEQPPAAYEQLPIQREVVYPNGKYVLEGDGVTQAYQWVWIPATPAVAPAIPPG